MWGRWGSRWAGVGAAGGQPPGLSTGCPCSCPRTGEAAHRSRSDLHISTARGSNSAPSGGLFCPAGLTTSVPGLGLLPGNVMRGHPRTPVRASHTTQLALQPRNPRRQPVLSWRHRKNKVATPNHPETRAGSQFYRGDTEKIKWRHRTTKTPANRLLEPVAGLWGLFLSFWRRPGGRWTLSRSGAVGRAVQARIFRQSPGRPIPPGWPANRAPCPVAPAGSVDPLLRRWGAGVHRGRA